MSFNTNHRSEGCYILYKVSSTEADFKSNNCDSFSTNFFSSYSICESLFCFLFIKSEKVFFLAGFPTLLITLIDHAFIFTCISEVCLKICCAKVMPPSVSAKYRTGRLSAEFVEGPGGFVQPGDVSSSCPKCVHGALDQFFFFLSSSWRDYQKSAAFLDMASGDLIMEDGL